MKLSPYQLESLLDASPDAMVIVDQNGIIVYVNLQAQYLFLYSREELLGESVDVLLPEQFQLAHAAHRSNYAENPRNRPMGASMNLKAQRKDGSEFPVEISLNPVPTEDGMWVSSTIRDVTNQRETEASLAGILEKSLNEIYIFDAKTLHFIHVNEGARNNLGYSMNELRCLTAVDIKPEIDQEAFEELLKPLRAGQKAQLQFKTVHQRKDGSQYFVEVHLQNMTFGGEAVYVAIILDISERVEAENAIRLQNRALDSSINGVIITDANDLEYPIVYCNPAFEELTGYSRDELLGKSCRILQGENRDQPEIKLIRDALLEDKPVRTVLMNYRKDGTLFWNDVRIAPVKDESGNVTHHVGIQNDVTERKKAEEVLRVDHDRLEQRVAERTQDLRQTLSDLEDSKLEAEKANTLKSRFLAAASHDLRQPLQSIFLYLAACHRTSLNSKQERLLQKIDNSVDTMRELLNALLDISSLEAGSIEPEYDNVDLAGLLLNIESDHEQQANEKGIELKCDAPALFAHTDRALLHRMIDNLVGNAVRYTSEGHVSLRVCKVDENLRVEVADTGIGIPQSDLDSIFEEYYQIDNPSRDKDKGLGLGLSIVNHISHLMDHPLEVESQLGRGTTFSITVPSGVAPAVDESTVQANDALRIDAATKVLFIDDDEAIRDAMYEVFDIQGLDTSLAGDGASAIELVEQGLRPDVVLSDYRLPGMNGVELIKALRETLEQDVPAIMMTGDTSSAQIRDANLPDVQILHKPANIDALLGLIETAAQTT